MLHNLQQIRLKLLQKEQFRKIAEATSDFVDNNIAVRITKIFKNLQQNNLETITNEHDKETPKERYASSEKRQEIIDDMRLKKQYNNGTPKNHKSFKKFTTK